MLVTTTCLAVVTLALLLATVDCSLVSQNPFVGRKIWTPSGIRAEIDTSILLNPSDAPLYERVKETGIGYWFDHFSSIDPAFAEFELASQANAADPDNDIAILTVIYNLPNRDCSAVSSMGDILCSDADCSYGLNQYKFSFINSIFNLISEYPDLFFIIILEPDSLPNLATKLDVEKCADSVIAYTEGIAYALETFSTLDHVSIYLDAAHGAWLGWQENQDDFVLDVINPVLDLCTISILTKSPPTARVDGFSLDLSVPLNAFNFDCSQLVRGFASNIAGYQPTGCASTCSTSEFDVCGLGDAFNERFTEVKYAVSMEETLRKLSGFDSNNREIGWIIDTSRNGAFDSRSDCGNWCNIDGSGLGYPTQANDPSITETDGIDALAWVKVPGHSDGVSGPDSDRYDYSCSSVDSVPNAPEAGLWFHDMFAQLVDNADPPIVPLTDSPTSSPTDQPTAPPTDRPTQSPSKSPTKSPTIPTKNPTDQPTDQPVDGRVDTTLSPTEASESTFVASEENEQSDEVETVSEDDDESERGTEDTDDETIGTNGGEEEADKEEVNGKAKKDDGLAELLEDDTIVITAIVVGIALCGGLILYLKKVSDDCAYADDETPRTPQRMRDSHIATEIVTNSRARAYSNGY